MVAQSDCEPIIMPTKGVAADAVMTKFLANDLTSAKKTSTQKPEQIRKADYFG
jgi:hypothetical protein